MDDGTLMLFFYSFMWYQFEVKGMFESCVLEGFEGEDFGGLSLYIDIYSRFKKIEGMS